MDSYAPMNRNVSTRKKVFEELWGEKCDVCLYEKEKYFINKCECKKLVCSTCVYRYVADRKTACPFCQMQFKLMI